MVVRRRIVVAKAQLVVQIAVGAVQVVYDQPSARAEPRDSDDRFFVRDDVFDDHVLVGRDRYAVADAKCGEE